MDTYETTIESAGAPSRPVVVRPVLLLIGLLLALFLLIL